MHLRLALGLLTTLTVLPAQDWTNAGGNPERNGRSSAYGPLTPQVAWSTGRNSLIA